MNKHRWMWTITLLFYFSGCTVYAPAYLPGDKMPEPTETTHTQAKTGFSPGKLPDDPQPSTPDTMHHVPDIVRVGLNIRLTLSDGETVSGTVLELNEDNLAFGKPGNYGLELEYYSFNDIEKIEVSKNTGLTNFVTVSVVALTVCAIVFIVGMAISLDENGW